jgi:glycine cleavage system aminomethyltransferase T
MTALLRRHGAVMVARHGHEVAAHFGSAAAEAAVCRTTVGIAVRPDRATLEVLGPPAAVDLALGGLVPLAGRAWSERVTPTLAIVRCERDQAGVVTAHLQRSDDVSVLDLPTEYVAIGLLGPRGPDVLAAAGVGTSDDPVIVMDERPGRVELLVPAAQGPALWNRLLAAGAAFGIACVGVDALEHLDASEHVRV